MRNLRELGDLVEKRFEAAREEGEGLPDLLTALERQWRLLRDTGLLGPDVWEERAEAVRRGEAQEAAASIQSSAAGASGG